MSGRKERPAVAPMSRAQRLIEIGKDILIVVLTVSAVFLAVRTPIFTELRGRIAPDPQVTETPVQQTAGAVTPYFFCVRNSLGLYGEGYDDTAVSQVFEDFSPLLGEALASASAPERIGRYQWRGLLNAPGVSCLFQGEPPLTSLARQLAGVENGDALTGSARMVVLAWSGDQVWLAWQDGDGFFYRSQTGLSYRGWLETAIEGYNPNGAAYAYTLAESDNAYSALDPSLPVSMVIPQPQVYTASAPDLVHDSESLETLLNALGFRSGVGSAYESAGELALIENGDRLRVGSSGSVTFRSGDDARYPAPSSSPTAAEAALCAWDLLERATAPWRGEAVHVLTGVETTGEGFVVTFHTRLDGIPVTTGTNGYSAAFTVSGGAITEFSLSLRTYTGTGETTLLPSARLAAAALRSMPDSDGWLELCYTDSGSGTVTAGWMSDRK